MMIVTLNLQATILAFLSLFVVFSHQWVGSEKERDQYFFQKPMVVPGGEINYHSIWIEYDTLNVGGVRKPMYAQILLAFISGKIVFTGIGEYVVRKNPDLYHFAENTIIPRERELAFFITNDLVQLKKEILKDVNNPPCKSMFKTRRSSFTFTDKNDFVMKYDNKWLMMYKESLELEKCIGTYDSSTDVFECVRYRDNDADKRQHVVIPNFFNDPAGTHKRPENSVEVFCRVPHVFEFHIESK